MKTQSLLPLSDNTLGFGTKGRVELPFDIKAPAAISTSERPV
jgi:hypothetical protein